MTKVTVELTIQVDNVFSDQEVFDLLYARLMSVGLGDYKLTDIVVEEGEYRRDGEEDGSSCSRPDESLQFGDDPPPGYEDPRDLDPNYNPGEPDVSVYPGDQTDQEAAETAADVTGGNVNKELFLKAVLQSADRLVARALENGPADIYDLQLIGTSGRCAFEGDDALEVVIHGEELIGNLNGTWFVEEQYRRERLDQLPPIKS